VIIVVSQSGNFYLCCLDSRIESLRFIPYKLLNLKGYSRAPLPADAAGAFAVGNTSLFVPNRRSCVPTSFWSMEVPTLST
jgi:hypothetical protein